MARDCLGSGGGIPANALLETTSLEYLVNQKQWHLGDNEYSFSETLLLWERVSFPQILLS